MKTPKIKGVAADTPSKHGNISPGNAVGVMTRSQMRRLSITKKSPKKISEDAKSTPVKSSRKLNVTPINRSLRSGVSSSVSVSSKRKKREDVEASDKSNIINTIIEEEETSKTRHDRYSKVAKNLEDEMNENDKINTIPSPEIKISLERCSEILNENKSFPNTNTAFMTRSRRSEVKKLENDANDKDNETKQIKSVRGRKDTNKYAEILDESESSQSTSKEGKTRSKRSICKKLENYMSDQVDKPKQIKSPQGRKYTNEHTETLNENKSSPSTSKDDKTKSRRSISKKFENDMIVDVDDDDDDGGMQIKSPLRRKFIDKCPYISDESEKSPSISKEDTPKSRKSISKKSENDISKEDKETKKIKSPEVGQEVVEYPEILNDIESTRKTNKGKTKLDRRVSKKLEDEMSEESKKIKSPEVRKDIDDHPEVLHSNKTSPKKSEDDDKAKKNVSKKLESDTNDEDSESKKIKSLEVSKDIDECLEIIYDSTPSHKRKLKRISKKLEDDTNEEDNEDKEIKSPEVRKDTDPEILLDSKSNSKKSKDKTKSKKSMSLTPAKKCETSPWIEIDISDSESESAKISTKESKQQAADVHGHISIDSSEIKTIIFKNSGKTLLMSDKIESDKTKNCSEGNQKNIQDNIPLSRGERSSSVDEIIASNSGVTHKVLSMTPNKDTILSSPEKTKGDIQFQVKEKVLSKNRITSSTETIKIPKSSKQPSLSPPFRNQSKQEFKSESSDSDSDAESRKAIKESAQKRIIQNISTSESDSKKFMRPVTKFYDVHSDSESAPEEMSFSAGHQLEIDSLKNVVESINKDKQRRKERRRQRLEKYKQQKEEKLIRLKEKRASQEDASCSSSEESGYEEDGIAVTSGKSKKKQRPKLEKENVDDPSKGKIKKFNISDDEAETKDRKEKKRKHEQMEVPQNVGNLRELPSDILESLPDQIPLKVPKFDRETSSIDKRKSTKLDVVKGKRQDFRNCSDIDYIPLSSCGSTEFGVMPLETLSRSSKSMAEQAADFKQRMLYGSHIKRAPANAHLVYQQKLKASGRDRLVR